MLAECLHLRLHGAGEGGPCDAAPLISLQRRKARHDARLSERAQDVAHDEVACREPAFQILLAAEPLSQRVEPLLEERLRFRPELLGPRFARIEYIEQRDIL